MKLQKGYSLLRYENEVTIVVYWLQKLGLQHYMLYGHGPDLCQDYSLRHAMANCFEALMGK